MSTRGGFEWTDDGLSKLNEYGEIETGNVEMDELNDGTIEEIHRSTRYKWNFH